MTGPTIGELDDQADVDATLEAYERWHARRARRRARLRWLTPWPLAAVTTGERP